MNSSVNWYFQAVDEQLGASDVYSYVQEIGYGNENMSGDFSSYWMESSLEISPIEQVELLTKLQNNSFGFAPENINAVKDAICLSAEMYMRMLLIHLPSPARSRITSISSNPFSLI